MDFESIKNTALSVIRDPAGFFRQMPKTGGLVDPLVFAAAIGVVTGLVTAIVSIIGVGTGFGLAAVILMPIFAVIGCFIGGGILFVIWKIMGSQEPYETAFRCVAYASAIGPVTSLLGIVPILGAALGTAWWFYVIIIASSETQAVKADLAWKVFGVLGAIAILVSMSSEMAARRAAKEAERWRETLEKQGKSVEEMSPEDAGRALGEFMKGFGDGAEKAKKE